MPDENSGATINPGGKYDSHKVEEANEDPIGRPSVLSSGNRDPSERPHTHLHPREWLPSTTARPPPK